MLFRSPWRLTRATHLAGFADYLSRTNQGRFSVELPRPRETFQGFLEELVVIEGLTCVLETSRYSLTIDVGRCFPLLPVCQAVADCVVRHFHPAETVVVEPDMKARFPESNRRAPVRAAEQGPTA